MESLDCRVSIAAAVAAFALSLPAQGADAPPSTAGAGHTPAAATGAPAPLPSQRVAGNGGVHPVLQAASAVSGARDGRTVQTTISDGRQETRGAHDRHETDTARTPNDEGRGG
jgi:hypothetical protein